MNIRIYFQRWRDNTRALCYDRWCDENRPWLVTEPLYRDHIDFVEFVGGFHV
jgi:hypothetical protein